MLTLHFQSKFARLTRAHLEQLGFPTPAEATDGDVLLQFHRLTERLIEPKPRRLCIAQGLQCPAAHRDGFEQLKQKIEAGDDLRPHLSRRLLNNDGLFNDWGIQHLHLGTTLEDDGFISRTGPLLYAKFGEEAAHLVTVAEHGQWTNTDLIQCIHDNWPEVIVSYKAEVSRDELTSAERKTLRKQNVNATVCVRDGTVYLPLGGGMMMNGVSMNARIRTDQLMLSLNRWEDEMLKNEANMRQHIATQGHRPPNPWVFDLWVEDGMVAAVSGQPGPHPFVVPLGHL